MTPRRPKPTGQSRQQIALKLRDRRNREEMLIVQAAEALFRRSAAEAEAAAATDALMGALAELDRLGFSLAEVAQLLEVDPSELTGTGPARRPTGRSTRMVDGAKSASPGDDQPE
jgi:hypothetical protein